MENEDLLYEALRKTLPAYLHAEARSLAKTIIIALRKSNNTEGTVEVSVSQDEASTLTKLVGKEINTPSSTLTFGEGGNFGDISIRDTAGRDIINFSFHVSNNTRPLPTHNKKALMLLTGTAILLSIGLIFYLGFTLNNRSHVSEVLFDNFEDSLISNTSVIQPTSSESLTTTIANGTLTATVNSSYEEKFYEIATPIDNFHLTILVAETKGKDAIFTVNFRQTINQGYNFRIFALGDNKGQWHIDSYNTEGFKRPNKGKSNFDALRRVEVKCTNEDCQFFINGESVANETGFSRDKGKIFLNAEGDYIIAIDSIELYSIGK